MVESSSDFFVESLLDSSVGLVSVVGLSQTEEDFSKEMVQDVKRNKGRKSNFEMCFIVRG
jgi:hypothetical protein